MLEQFDARVLRLGADACWTWTGSCNPAGYGQLVLCSGADRMALLAHRVAWTIENGAIPAGKLVLHRCDNPPCCNLAHLFLGTARDNSDDMIAKGRQPAIGPMTGILGTDHPRSLYDDAIRDEAVRLYCEEHWHRVRIARHLGCHRWSVSRWIKEAGDRLIG